MRRDERTASARVTSTASLRVAPWALSPAKRLLDVAFSLAALLLFFWVYLLVAVAIKLDDPSEPAIFRQVRVGLDGREFTLFKFRSMHAGAEELRAELEHANEKDGPVFKVRDDPRVTRVGRFLRKASLDELPQFWNVLKGDMSVVGPRPALPCEVCQYSPHARQRLLVKPGMTCYWQTRRNRDSITFDKWVELDLLYVQRASLWADVKLVVQTVGCVLTFQGE